MKVVIDSNVLLIAIGKQSHYRPIWDAFMSGYFQLIISEDILHEYEEILNEHSARGAAEIIMEIISESSAIIYKQIFYAWNVINADPDDNKFFDAAVAGNADYLVTNDAHFNEAKRLAFPVVNIINADKFMEILNL